MRYRSRFNRFSRRPPIRRGRTRYSRRRPMSRLGRMLRRRAPRPIYRGARF